MINSVSRQEVQSTSHGLSQVNTAMQAVLTTFADSLGRQTGLIQRQVKLSGSGFARLLVLGWLHNPKASLEQLAQFGGNLGLDITAQGIDERWSEQAVSFMQALFEVALTQVVVADPVAIPLLERFGAVVLEDSTQIRLLEALALRFRGSGSHPGTGAHAVCKLHLRLDMLRGQLTASSLLDGVSADCKTPLARVPLSARTLSIRDRGFFDLLRIRREAEQGNFSLTYLKGGTLLFDSSGQPLDLLLLLALRRRRGQMEPLELEVQVGKKEHIAMRLFASLLPADIVEGRRGVLKKAAQKHGLAVSHTAMLLAAYDIMLTNVPVALLSLQEAQVLIHLRWQIELLIKLWKQDGLLDEWRTANPQRVLCEVYAKLIGLLIQHWLLVVSCWQDPYRSLPKAAKAVREHAIMLAYAYAGVLSLDLVLRLIRQAALRGSRQNKRKKHPSTTQCILDPPLADLGTFWQEGR
jgi:hypothetical protein